MIPSLRWLDDEGVVEMIDQTKLPYELVFLKIATHEAMAQAIKVMNVRGAPAIGVAAAMGMTLAAQQASVAKRPSRDSLLAYLEKAKKTIDSTRPTAVNLFWATSRMMAKANITQGNAKEIVAHALQCRIPRHRAIWHGIGSHSIRHRAGKEDPSHR
jgi:methylthioribose-1-phosphate isomerase